LGTVAERAVRPPTGVPELRPPEVGGALVAGDGGYFAARELLAAEGVRFAEARPAQTIAEAVVAAAELGYPVAVKALGRTHKSDDGGVVLNVENEETLRSTISRMARLLSPGAYAIERMVVEPTAVELIVGSRRDARFAPVLPGGIG